MNRVEKRHNCIGLVVLKTQSSAFNRFRGVCDLNLLKSMDIFALLRIRFGKQHFQDQVLDMSSVV